MLRKVVVASAAVVGTLWTEQMCRRRDGTVGRRRQRESREELDIVRIV
jgi:hypothetical protein